MKFLDFSLLAGKLKTLKRTGWMEHRIHEVESVADHSFRTALLAMTLAAKVGVDQDKAIKMALIHDLAEAEIGDIVTRIGTKTLPNVADKHKAEREAMAKILSLLDSSDELLKLFDEFEENKTPVAQFVKQVDILEMAVQAYAYENQHGANLQEFFDDANERITIPELKKILSATIARRV